MKIFRSLILLVILLTFGLSACQKPIDFPEGSGPGGGKKPSATFFKAKVNGVWVECKVDIVQLINDPATNYIQISATKGLEGFSLLLQNYTGVGTYSLTYPNSGTYIKDFKDPYAGSFLASSGSVKITSATGKIIKGTFEFKGENLDGTAEKNITEGSFEVTLEVPNGPTPGDNDKNLSTKVDGALVSFVSTANLIQTPIGKTLSIAGANGSKLISIVIYDFTGPGTYTIDDLAQIGYNKDQSQTGSFMSETGKVVVTSYTGGVIKGTFECVAPNEDSRLNTKVTLTEGKFEVKP